MTTKTKSTDMSVLPTACRKGNHRWGIIPGGIVCLRCRWSIPKNLIVAAPKLLVAATAILAEFLRQKHVVPFEFDMLFKKLESVIAKARTR